jgi:hypothetical protein
MSKIIIRPATTGDVPAIVDLAVESVSVNPLPVRLDRQAMGDTARALIIGNQHFSWVSTQGRSRRGRGWRLRATRVLVPAQPGFRAHVLCARRRRRTAARTRSLGARAPDHQGRGVLARAGHGSADRPPTFATGFRPTVADVHLRPWGLGHMVPGESPADARNRVVANANGFRQLDSRESGRTNVFNIGLREFGQMLPLPASDPSFRRHISLIVGRGASEEMVWVHAQRNVAPVASEFSREQRSVVPLKRISMGQYVFAFVPEKPVTRRIPARTGPEDTVRETRCRVVVEPFVISHVSGLGFGSRAGSAFVVERAHPARMSRSLASRSGAGFHMKTPRKNNRTRGLRLCLES